MDISQTPVKKFQATHLNRLDNDLPKISVIIPVYNNAKGLKDTLTALQKQTYPKEKLEIIVVDNNSTDGSDQIAAQTDGIILAYERDIQSAGAARNKALSIATGSIIAFTDADCIPALDWLEQGVLMLQQLEVDRIAGQMVINPITPESSAAALLDVMYNFNQEYLIKTYQAAVTANLLVKHFIFDKTGNFDSENLIEDMEFGRRASALGFTIAYAPKCIVYHPPRVTFQAMWEKSQRCGRGIFSLCLKEKLGGWMGWKYPARVLRILLFPRQLYWVRLPFPPNQISWQKRLQIYFLFWLVVHLPEGIGYTQWGLRFLTKKLLTHHSIEV